MEPILNKDEYTYYLIGNVDDFTERLGRVVRLGNEEIAIFKTTDGHIYALENKSPGPRGGTIAEGIISGDVLFDPICDWKISLTDGQVLDPDTGQVRTYPVQVHVEEVRVGLLKNVGETFHE
ncbi:nitrite reductase (NAD(P)H) small subunit [Paenibacillus polysaccharolyticus]|uniref:nitrite reductase (NAD(P)H) small subunit n=1 Tax=Paenibacillus polysaccharolyticus TaxID=582692 RepID=UPI00203AFFD4|nr:nitrite reductase (NAD(P)H) small subunit [Paenibacillus polysaccharolyticus]MCM3132848.1 nitrite reductase (NAD(P)H) small subunit [Paenibacillus polysaccharolyticus]